MALLDPLEDPNCTKNCSQFLLHEASLKKSETSLPEAFSSLQIWCTLSSGFIHPGWGEILIKIRSKFTWEVELLLQTWLCLRAPSDSHKHLKSALFSAITDKVEQFFFSLALLKPQFFQKAECKSMSLSPIIITDSCMWQFAEQKADTVSCSLIPFPPVCCCLQEIQRAARLRKLCGMKP